MKTELSTAELKLKLQSKNLMYYMFLSVHMPLIMMLYVHDIILLSCHTVISCFLCAEDVCCFKKFGRVGRLKAFTLISYLIYLFFHLRIPVTLLSNRIYILRILH